jgi:hypothetical protein
MVVMQAFMSGAPVTITGTGVEVVLAVGARPGVAVLAGAVLGIDRDLRDKPAGLRVHALVTLGAALVTVVGVQIASSGRRIEGRVVEKPERAGRAPRSSITSSTVNSTSRAAPRTIAACARSRSIRAWPVSWSASPVVKSGTRSPARESAAMLPNVWNIASPA